MATYFSLMKRFIYLILFSSLPITLLAQNDSLPRSVRMQKCEPSIIINVGGGPTRLDNVWRGEFTLDVAMGVQFRNGHAAYIGMAMQQMQRESNYQDRRTSRTNLPLYLQYQWRAFGWHRDCQDRHMWSPFLGLKAGWNFLQDVHVDESLENQHVDDLRNQEFITPQVGIDFRCAEYMSLGLSLECEISRRYIGDGGGYCKPRASLTMKF